MIVVVGVALGTLALVEFSPIGAHTDHRWAPEQEIRHETANRSDHVACRTPP
jgi:hypothetical protein